MLLQVPKVVLVLHEAFLENLEPVDFVNGVAVRVAHIGVELAAFVKVYEVFVLHEGLLSEYALRAFQGA